MNIADINPNQPTSIKQQSPIDLKLTGEVKCNKCNGIAFTQAVIFRSVSALISPSGKAGFYPIETWACMCGHINDSFLPVELRAPKLT